MPNGISATPLRTWWEQQPPDTLPDDLDETTRELVRGFAGGTIVADLAATTGLMPAAILGRLTRVAVRLGYQHRGRTSWLLPDGRIADHAVQRDPVSGCVIGRGQVRRSEIDPRAHLPRATSDGTHPPRSAVVRLAERLITA